MKTFEEYLAYQKYTPTPCELEAWRIEFHERCKAESLREIWTPRVRNNPQELLYAVAVRDACELWLALWVKRSIEGEYFVLIPRDDRRWNPHASYHLSGQLHQKGHNHEMIVHQRQIPGPGFRGTEQMLTTGLDLESVRSVKARCDTGYFTEVLEIPGEIFRGGRTTIGVDLTDANGSAIEHPCCQIIIQRRFSETIPEILLTLWRY